ncbi:MAG: hypothetical protein Q8O25_16665 [Sulfurisoma sp.]|nr:hypothetical protein [Sulfurisoma sp.]
MRTPVIALVAACTLLAAGCAINQGSNSIDSLFSPIERRIPGSGALVPDATVQVLPSFGISLEKLVYWGAYAAAAYLILDPLAPNWQIEVAAFPGDHVHFSLHMKRHYSGGAGEARQVFQRRARQIVREGGYEGYEVVEYSEGLESSVLGSQRIAEGVIRLTRKLG